jgi:hypothetical protein
LTGTSKTQSPGGQLESARSPATVVAVTSTPSSTSTGVSPGQPPRHRRQRDRCGREVASRSCCVPPEGQHLECDLHHSLDVAGQSSCLKWTANVSRLHQPAQVAAILCGLRERSPPTDFLNYGRTTVRNAAWRRLWLRTRNPLRLLPQIALRSFVLFSTMVFWSVLLSLTVPNVDQRDTGIVRDRQLSFGRGARVLAAELSKTGADDA